MTATKTGERRGLALDGHTRALIEKAWAERSSNSPWVFGEDEHPPSPDKIGWWWKRTRELAEIDPRWRLHDLRHWSATHAIAGGHNVRSVAARLGHADPTTTMRTYAHALEGLDQPIEIHSLSASAAFLLFSLHDRILGPHVCPEGK